MKIMNVRPGLIPDQRRDEQIERYDVLGQPPGRDLQALVELAAQVCGVSAAAINLITSDRSHAIATIGLDPSSYHRDDSMCTPVLEDPSVVVVDDATKDTFYATNPMVTGELARVRFYASAPLRAEEGDVVGRLCVFDRNPHTLDDQQRNGLQTLADRVMDVLALRMRNRQLECSLAELTQTQDLLRRSNDQLALFAGQVSHDLSNPLTGMLINIELLLTEPVVAQDSELAGLAEGAQRGGERMARLIDKLLAHAGREGSVLKRDTDLGDVVRSALDDLGSVVASTGADVQVGQLPTVCADPVLLYSVMLNLLSNAVKFARPGVPPRITVRSRRLPGRWRVAISDEGIGIPASQHAEVFTLFTRLEESTDGHGIGLASARRLVEAHGGQMELTIGRQIGTEVWFDLPR